MASSSSSSSSATVAVEKATSDLLLVPDWTMNIEICDSINSHHWQTKDVVKAVRKRLQHKSSKVQLLTLTLLETMVKNCGEFVHFQIAERKILEEMIKIVRKKADMQVRDKILVLLDSWQEAFGGPGGKHPQYYWACEELRRSGVVFPKRSPDAAPIFTPPPTHPTLRHMQAGYGMPINSSKRLDETMATEIESLSLSSLDSMRHVMELLGDMLQAVNPGDHVAVKDEVIIDLVERCRTNQKKLMQMLTTTGDEELLGRGLELNDSTQSLLARHDAIASGTPLPTQDASSSSQSTEAFSSSFNANEVRGSSLKDSGPTPKDPSTPVSSVTRGQIEEEEEEDEFAQLARRHSRTQTVPPKDATTGSSEDSISMNTSNVPEPPASNALVAIPNPTAPITTSKEQDLIDLLSLTLSTSSVSTQTPATQEMHQASVPSSSEGYPYASQTYSGNLSYNSYVVPWAQPQPKSQSQGQFQQIYQPSSQPPQQFQQHHEPQHLQHQQQPQHLQSQPQSQSQSQNQHLQYSAPRPQSQPQPVHVVQPQLQPQLQNQHLQYSAPQPQPQPVHVLQPQLLSQLQNQHLQYSAPQQQPQPQPQPVHAFQPQPESQIQNQHLQYFAPQQQPPPQPESQIQQPQPESQIQNQHCQYSAPQQQPPPQPQPVHAFQPQPESQIKNQHLQYSTPQRQLQPPHESQQFESQVLSQPRLQPQPQQQPQQQSVLQPQPQSQLQNQHHQYPSRYPPPPWAPTPGYPNNQISASNIFSTPGANTTAAYTPAQGVRPLQHNNSFPSSGDPRGNLGPRNPASATGQKPFIPSYRLFEDLNVFGNTDGRIKMTSSGTSSSLSGTMGPGMIGGRK